MLLKRDGTRNTAPFTSKSQVWATPQRLFDELNAEFGFTLDAAASAENAKCPVYFTEADNALVQTWNGRIFLNPPYRHVGDWVTKACSEVRSGNAELVVMLIPARTDARWFHEHVWKRDDVEIRFVKGRIRFEGAKNGAPFPSMILVIRRTA